LPKPARLGDSRASSLVSPEAEDLSGSSKLERTCLHLSMGDSEVE